MKKIISFIITVAVLLGALAVSTDAVGTLVFNDNFDDGFRPMNWINGRDCCAFYWDNISKCIHGYSDARVLQTNFSMRDPRMWDQFYAKFDVQIRGFDDLDKVSNSHVIRLWYRDLFENAEGSQGARYEFCIEIETGRAYLEKFHSFKYRDENGVVQNADISNVIAEGKISGQIEIGENAPWYEMGIRITSGKIEGYFEQELVLSAEADENDEKLGDVALYNVDPTVGSQKSPVLFINGSKKGALWTALDNFEVWTSNYDFTLTNYGDADNDSSVNLADAVAIMQYIAKWDVTINESASDVNVDGIVNIADVVLIMQYAAGWDVVLGK